MPEGKQYITITSRGGHFGNTSDILIYLNNGTKEFNYQNDKTQQNSLTADMSLSIIQELLSHDTEHARIRAEPHFNLVVAIVHPEDPRPLRPRVVAGPLRSRFRQDFEGGDRGRALTKGSRDAIAPGVSASDDDYVLVFGVGSVVVRAQLLLLPALEELHGEVDTVELTA